MKVIDSLEERREVYNKVKNSGLYDTALKMVCFFNPFSNDL